jgi:DNA-binding MarR family transcriptional regulator
MNIVMVEKQDPVAEIRSFNRFYTNIIGILDRHILESPFSLSEARIMFEIHKTGSCTAREIKNTINMDEGYLSRIIEKFVSNKIIKKTRSKGDARVFNLSLTVKGSNIFTKLNAVSENEIRHMIQPISRREVKDLVRNMQNIRKILSKAG